MGSSTRDRKRKARDQPESTAALTAAPTAASENHGAAPWRVTVLFLQAVTNEGRSRSKKSSRRRSTSKDQTPAEPLALEVRDTARADEDAPAPAGSRSPRRSRVFWSPSPLAARSCIRFSSSTRPDPLSSHLDPVLMNPGFPVPRRRFIPGRRRENSANACSSEALTLGERRR